MSENGEIYTAGKNFTLPPALTALTNSTSGHMKNVDLGLEIDPTHLKNLPHLKKS